MTLVVNDSTVDCPESLENNVSCVERDIERFFLEKSKHLRNGTFYLPPARLSTNGMSHPAFTL